MARRRLLRPQVAPNTEDMGPITPNGGAILPVPSVGENVPDPPAGALWLHPPSGTFEFSQVSDDFQGFGERAPAGQTPKKEGGKPDAPRPQRPRADSQEAQGVGHGEFLARH